MSAQQRAYRAWLLHAQGCGACRVADKPGTGCADGRELWGAYRLARIGGDHS